ncbi:MAG: diguanylate cyclase [bacterium]
MPLRTDMEIGVSEALTDMVEVSPLDETLETVAREACVILSADACFVVVETQRGRGTGLCATHNLSDEYLRIMGEAFAEISEDVIIRNTHRLIDNLELFLINRRNDRGLNWIRRNSYCSMLCAPVTVADSAVGALHLYYKKPRRMTRTYEKLLSEFSRLSGVAAVNAKYFERSQHQIAELCVLNEVGQAINSSLHLDKLLELIYTETSKIMDTSNFYIALYDQKRGEITFEFIIEDWRRRAKIKRKLGSGLSEWIIRNMKPLLITRRVNEYAGKLGIEPVGKPAKSWMGVPLIARNKVLGVMAVQSYDEEAAYDRGHLNVFLTIANQAAGAIENANLYEKMRRLATTDGLTGVFNRRHFRKVLNRETARLERYGGRASVAIIDLDRIKLYNDKHGHQAGDHLLKRTAIALVKNFRQVDIVARYGGDEFVVLLPSTGREDALTACEGVSSLLKRKLNGSGRRPALSLSIGIATYPDHARTAEGLVYAADMALYNAKRLGRNRICVAAKRRGGARASGSGGNSGKTQQKDERSFHRKSHHSKAHSCKRSRR